MPRTRVTTFRPYPFTAGQKIRITDSHRAGDWLVVKVSERTITLRCPISQKEVEWDLFCFLAEEQEDHWPARP